MSLVCPTVAARGCHRGPSCTDALKTEHFSESSMVRLPREVVKESPLKSQFPATLLVETDLLAKTGRTSQPLIFFSFFWFCFFLRVRVFPRPPSLQRCSKPNPYLRPTTAGGWALRLNFIVRRLFLVNIAFLIHSFRINSLLICTSRSNSHHGVN